LPTNALRRVAAAAALVGLVALPARLRAGPQDPDALAKVSRITVAELKKLIAAGSVVIIDVRNGEAFEAGHLPGAFSVPLDTVAARALELAAKKKTVVTYCS
jgi:predicted sulfurtransferase